MSDNVHQYEKIFSIVNLIVSELRTENSNTFYDDTDR